MRRQSATTSLISGAFDTLIKHQDLIQQVYLSGSYHKDGSKNDRRAYVLQQHRIFIPGGKETFLLSAPLTRFLDEVTQRQRLYDVLGEKAAAQVTRVWTLVEEYKKSVMAGRTDEADIAIDDFHMACAELADTFGTGISKLLYLAETNFAVVNSIEAKNRQNRHFLQQAKYFSSALRSLDGLHIEEEIDNLYCENDSLKNTYRTLILERKIEWHTEILRLIQFFESYLFRLRELAPDVKRFRQFAGFLEQTPGYEPPDLEDTHHRPQWMMRDMGIRPAAYADPGDRKAFDYLCEVTSSLPEAKESITRVKETGRIERAPHKTLTVLRPPAHLVALSRFVREAAKSLSPLSALDWKRGNYPDMDVPDDVWLLLVIHSKDYYGSEFSAVRHQRVERSGESRISRNKFVQDVMVHGL